MTQLQAIRKFADCVAQEHVVVYRSKDDDYEFNFAYSKPHLGIPTHLMARDEGDKLYRKFFIELCPMGRGFADVTISILHEIGHHFNREILIFETNFAEYEKTYGYDHYKYPCELAATNWAIAWLQDSQNRKIAKAFERDFFGY